MRTVRRGDGRVWIRNERLPAVQNNGQGHTCYVQEVLLAAVRARLDDRMRGQVLLTANDAPRNQ
jgi:hypothetical protein